MRLQDILNKFTNMDFMLSVDGLCDEMPFCDYPSEKKQPYWYKYKKRKVKSMSIIITNGFPELSIRLEDL